MNTPKKQRGTLLRAPGCWQVGPARIMEAVQMEVATKHQGG